MSHLSRSLRFVTGHLLNIFNKDIGAGVLFEQNVRPNSQVHTKLRKISHIGFFLPFFLAWFCALSVVSFSFLHKKNSQKN